MDDKLKKEEDHKEIVYDDDEDEESGVDKQDPMVLLHSH